MLRTILLSFALGSAALIAVAVLTTRGGAAPQHDWAATAIARNQQPLERLDLLQIVRAARRPKIGELAADLDSTDEIGARFRLRIPRDRPLLFGAFCTCPTCKETARKWSALLRRYPARFEAAALVALPRGDQLFDFHESLGIDFPLVPDPDHALSAQFPGPGEGTAALTCPRAWVIDGQSRYRYVMPAGSAPTDSVIRAISRALGLPES